MRRCDFPLAHQEIAKEDSQGSEEGCLYWSLASKQNPVHRSEVNCLQICYLSMISLHVSVSDVWLRYGVLFELIIICIRYTVIYFIWREYRALLEIWWIINLQLNQIPPELEKKFEEWENKWLKDSDLKFQYEILNR